MFVDAENKEWETVAPGVRRKVLGYDEHLMMVCVDFEKGAIGASHSHPHRQVTYVASGRFEVKIGDEERVLQVGDSFFVPPGIVHSVIALEEGRLIDVFTPSRLDFLKK